MCINFVNVVSIISKIYHFPYTYLLSYFIFDECTNIYFLPREIFLVGSKIFMSFKCYSKFVACLKLVNRVLCWLW